MLRNILLSIIFILTFIFIASCSSGDGNIPALSPERAPVDEETGKMACLGFWQVTIDRDAGTIEAVDMRSGDFILNVLGFLEPPALSGMTIDFGTLIFADPIIEVDVILTHPIPDPVFMGFDVRGVVFGPDVVNCDGLTVIPSPEFFRGVPFGYQDGLLGAPDSVGNYEGLAGYKYFCDGLGLNDDLATFFADPLNLANRGVFSQSPQQNTRHYVLDWGNVTHSFMVFNYAIYANYNWPSGSPPIDLEDFFITTSNSREAFCASVTETYNTMGYCTPQTCGNGLLSLNVEIFDWMNNVTGVTIESFIPGIIAQTPQTSVGAGSTSKSKVWTFTNVPAVPISAGDFDILITATDPKTFGESWFMNMLPVTNPMWYEYLYNCFKYTTTVIECPVPVIEGTYSGAGNIDDVILNVNGLSDLPGLAVRLYNTTNEWVGTDVKYIDSSHMSADFNLMTAPFFAKLSMEVTNGCCAKGSKADCWSTDLVFKVVGTPNINVGSGPIDIMCDPSSNQSGIQYGPLMYWRRYTNNYTSYSQYGAPFGREGYYFDCSADRQYVGVNYGTPPPPYFNLRANLSWSGGGGGSYYNAYYLGDRDVANMQVSGDEFFMAYEYGSPGYTIYFYRATGTSTGSIYCYGNAPWFNGAGTTGVVINNLRGIDMDLGTPYKMYILEDLPGPPQTGVVEKWRLNSGASMPTYDGVSFGQGQFYNAMDITVDALGLVYVLDGTSTGAAKIWLFDSSGNLLLSKEFVPSEVSGKPLRIDASIFLSEVHILHTGGVTRVSVF